MAAELGIVEESVGRAGGCPALGRVKAFLVQQGTRPWLAAVVRDGDGEPIDLGPFLATVSESDSDSASAGAEGGVTAFLAEAIDDGHCRRWPGEIRLVDGGAAHGALQVRLPRAAMANAGIYRLCLGVHEDLADDPLYVSTSLVSVERSLFFNKLTEWSLRGKGPPTLQEVRMAIMDSDPVENDLLEHEEFGADQIVSALERPVRYFNETIPILRNLQYSTRTFPYREAWMRAIVGYLLQIAAANFRRNKLKVVAGGVEEDNKNRDREYDEAAARVMAEWQTFVLATKTSISVARCRGATRGPYGPPY